MAAVAEVVVGSAVTAAGSRNKFETPGCTVIDSNIEADPGN